MIIYKYTLTPGTAPKAIQLAKCHKILSVAVKPGEPVVSVWILSSGRNTNTVTREFYVEPTGQDITSFSIEDYENERVKYVDTAVCARTGLVWHVFARTPISP